MKVKCTYKDCFKHFSSRDAMISHKKKDPDHSYCDRCDVDCEDDMLYFIHQLGSPAHNCCPVCGTEYNSVAARDIHVEQQHRTSQKLECAGCKTRFTSAAALMFHIESDECTVIKMTDFQLQRAEKQLEKEAWAQETNAFGLPQINPGQQSRDQASAQLGFIDDVPASRVDRSLQTAIGGPISTASLQQFPLVAPPTAPTASDPQIPGNQPNKATASTKDFLNPDEPLPLVNMTNLHISQRPAWANHQPTEGATSATNKIEGWLDSIGTTARPPQENRNAVVSIYDQKLTTKALQESSAPTFKGIDSVSTKPSGKHDHVTTQPRSVISTSTGLDVERFWDVMRQEYVCPGSRCSRQFNDAQQFRDHLLSSSHVGGVVVCPSCLKRFRTTAAWVSHTESASKKCDIRNSADFNMVMREITGGVLGTYGYMEDGTVNFVAPKIQDW
ncbi:uncharacterized protein A1O9_10806 [Exophiala aquamarina CBS 119918]|uniref:C2H2-type domain-containing protein n=1 Tax=Exophiala aquamarina CBS 119918 TaxID=1182545 RepID=A0A072PBG2_9EURO|nr:uncharacterized protein A1O9_10806 [Exophiala aquamarina CBS 119918]KEF52900.1 hypothetical protein A1O9_10806 [Exophiala aquamarina CBS 119918]